MKKYLFFFIILGFLALYSLYIFKVNIKVEYYSDIVITVVFFFTIFSGFFITRQNDRYTAIAEEISHSDGLFSLLYRVSGVVPRVQNKVREALREHYKKIVDSNNWAYHILNPSTTITRIFKAYSEVNDEEREKLDQFSNAWAGAFADLQVSRKKMIILYNEKLLPLQWALINILAILLIVSFNFIPTHSCFINILKIIFGLAVLFVVLLLKQLNDLSLFGKDFNKHTAEDIFRIINEKDIAEIQR